MTYPGWIRRVRRPLTVIVGVVVLGLLASRVLGYFGIDLAGLDVPGLARVLRSWGAWSALASIGLMLVHSVVPFPAEVIVIANGMIFGPLLGAAITWTGAMLGAVAAYAAARYWGRLGEAGEGARDGVAWRRIADASRRPTTLLAVRLMPMISFNLINYALGMLGVGWWRFLWTTALGILPATLALSWFGRAALDAPVWVWIVAAVGLALMPAALPYLSRPRGDSPPPDSAPSDSRQSDQAKPGK